MKRLIVLLTLMMPLALSAQIDLGLQAGPAFTKITFDSDSDDLSDAESTHKAGFQGGAFLRVNIKKLYLSPAVYYTLRQSEASAELGGSSIDIWETTTHSLDVPLQVGYNIVKVPFFKLRAQTGPVLSFNFASETEYAETLTVQEDPDFSTAALGWRIGAGVDVWKFTLDAGYEFGVTDVADAEFYGGNDTRNRANVIYALIGFKLL